MPDVSCAVEVLSSNRRSTNESAGVFFSVSGKTSDCQTSYLNTVVIEKYSSQTKVVGLCADNMYTNVGGTKRLGQTIMWRRLQKSLGMNVFGIGWGAQIVQSCLQ